jgi:micrococcal nuclease
MILDYKYRAQYASNYDGDTIRLDIDLGFYCWQKNQIFRLLGIDCPELRGDTLASGQLARDYVKGVLSSANEIIVESKKDSKDKYGRWLATVFYRTGAEAFVNLNEELVQLGFATRRP